jgi:hypothetical protein
VDLDLSRDGGVTWLPLARGVTGEHLTIRAAGASSEHMRVRVRDSAVSARADASDAPFSVCGLFRSGVRTPLGFAAAQLERADLDGDGVDDAVAASATQAAVLRGTGDGRFVPGAPFDVDASRRMRLADVNADGLADLVTLGAGTLAWRAGDGAGAFGLPRLVAMSGGGLRRGRLRCRRPRRRCAAGEHAAAHGWCGAGTAPFETEWSAPVNGAPQQLVAADLTATASPTWPSPPRASSSSGAARVRPGAATHDSRSARRARCPAEPGICPWPTSIATAGWTWRRARW